MADDKEESFKVTDRRKFNPDGTPRDRSADDRPEDASAGTREGLEDPGAAAGGSSNVVSFPGDKAGAKEQPQQSRDSASGSDRPPGPSSSVKAVSSSEPSAGGEARLPDASFGALVNMLAFEAALHLGLIENAGGRTIDLDAARHMINMLSMLKEKTAGNLAAEERELIEAVLADLRMHFVGVSKRR